MLLSHLSKSSNHIVLHLRQRAWKKAHGEMLLSALFQKGRRYEGKAGSGCFFPSLCCPLLPRVQTAWSQHPYEIWGLVVIFFWKRLWSNSEKAQRQAHPESRLQHLKVVFATKSTVRQQVPVFTEKILAYSSSVSLFYCHMRRMHSTYVLLRDLNC